MIRQLFRRLRYLLLAVTVSGLACVSIFDGCMPEDEATYGINLPSAGVAVE